MYARFDADINDKIISLLVKFLLKSAGNALYKVSSKIKKLHVWVRVSGHFTLLITGSLKNKVLLTTFSIVLQQENYDPVSNETLCNVS